MSDKTQIEWTDATWNPLTGCTRVSPGCDHCYIDWAPPFRIENRHFTVPCPLCASSGNRACRRCGGSGTIRSNAPGSTTGVQLHPERLEQPLRWRRPRKVFVNSLSDLFHPDVPDEFIVEVFAIMAQAPRHVFQVLTKRHGRMRALLQSESFELAVYNARSDDIAEGDDMPWPLPNVWLGVTVEDQKHAELRVPALLDTPAAVRFLSCEPLLGPVDVSRLLTCQVCLGGGGLPAGAEWPLIFCSNCDGTGTVIDWVIVGGESGTDARPMHPDWARALRTQCETAAVPFLFKQWGEWAHATDDHGYQPSHTKWLTSKTPSGGHRSIYLDHLGVERTTNDLSTFTIPSDWARLARVGKRNAGRSLDGRHWNGYPLEGQPGNA